ncbi:hypothetical protein BGZ51_008219 [Haplosporangium sp. Z 767]|nr:hypothetical protein BGZ50_004849 [Haplosporangium sp. Z 11]KAF9190816.1 hypothetical protein BGZ51_008219 [Haplosporangium sp. Z 767]
MKRKSSSEASHRMSNEYSHAHLDPQDIQWHQQQPYTSPLRYFPQPPQAPVLTFRTFHANHFSSSQRQAFFGRPAPIDTWTSEPPIPLWSGWSQPPAYSIPIGADTLANPSHEQPLSTDHKTGADGGVEEERERHLTLAESDDPSPSSPIMPQLSREAIEIFEFSRRFRQQKAAAERLEQAHIKKRNVKKRRVTTQGFTIGNGSNAMETSHSDGVNNLEVGDDHALESVEDRNNDGGQDGNEDEDEDEDTDQGSIQEEPSALDISFMSQRDRQRERVRKRLYGQPDTSAGDPAVFSGLQTIEILEAMLNQTYHDSIGLNSFDKRDGGKKDQDANTNDASQSHTRLPGHSSADRRTKANKIVYWPGIPLRC